MDATCSDIQDNIQYNCTAEFTLPSVEIIQSVNVTVSGPYGSNYSVVHIKKQSKWYLTGVVMLHYQSYWDY